MKMELRNDTLLVKYDSKWEMQEIEKRAKASGLVLPESAYSLSVDSTTPGYSGHPVLRGEIVQVGPGKKIKDGSRFVHPDLKVGQKVMFQVQNQIAYTDKKTSDIIYLIGVGNVLALVEDECTTF